MLIENDCRLRYDVYVNECQSQNILSPLNLRQNSKTMRKRYSASEANRANITILETELC